MTIVHSVWRILHVAWRMPHAQSTDGHVTNGTGAHDDVEIYILDQQAATAATTPAADPAAAGAPACDVTAAPSAEDVPIGTSAGEAQPAAGPSAAPADP
jgi:hypothetical protein